MVLGLHSPNLPERLSPFRAASYTTQHCAMVESVRRAERWNEKPLQELYSEALCFSFDVGQGRKYRREDKKGEKDKAQRQTADLAHLALYIKITLLSVRLESRGKKERPEPFGSDRWFCLQMSPKHAFCCRNVAFQEGEVPTEIYSQHTCLYTVLTRHQYIYHTYTH